MIWNLFFMYVCDPITEEVIETRTYDRPGKAVEGIMKAYNYYLAINRDMNIQFRDWENKLIITLKTSEKEYEFELLNNQQNGKINGKPSSGDSENAPQLFN